MGQLRNFKLIHTACGNEAKIVWAHSSKKYDDVDENIILEIRCEYCDKTIDEEI